jgi:hypothetical protein
MKKIFDNESGESVGETLFTILLSALLMLIIYFIDAWIGVWLWNDIIGLPWFNGGEMTFWPMFGIIWLGHMIFPSRDND